MNNYADLLNKQMAAKRWVNDFLTRFYENWFDGFEEPETGYQARNSLNNEMMMTGAVQNGETELLHGQDGRLMVQDSGSAL